MAGMWNILVSYCLQRNKRKCEKHYILGFVFFCFYSQCSNFFLTWSCNWDTVMGLWTSQHDKETQWFKLSAEFVLQKHDILDVMCDRNLNMILFCFRKWTLCSCCQTILYLKSLSSHHVIHASLTTYTVFCFVYSGVSC